MKNCTFPILLIAFFVVCGCDEEVSTNSSRSYTEDGEEYCKCVLTYCPSSADISIYVSCNDANPKVPYTIYSGKMTDNKIILSDTATENRNVITLPVDVTYTAAAKYLSGKDTVIVPVNFKPEAEDYQCDGSNCWQIVNDIVYLELKN